MKKRKITHTVSVKGSEICFTLARDRVTDYATYHDTLFEILSKDCLKPFRDEGRLRFHVWRDGRNESFYFYDLAVACYEGIIQADTFLDDLQRYYDYKSSKNLSVDHADNNVHNNTRLNISLMDRKTNAAKNSITAHFMPPYYLNSAYCGREYRIQFECTIDSGNMEGILSKFGVSVHACGEVQATMLFRCLSAEDYADCLHHLAELSYEWCNPTESPKSHYRKNKHLEYWANDALRSIEDQKKLTTMDKRDFQDFPLHLS